jgi:thiol-disulfide isomerase/thioredoxin
MKSPRTATWIPIGFACLAVAPAILLATGDDVYGAGQQDQAPGGGQGFSSVAEVESAYARQSAELDRKKLADLAALAGRQSGIEAERAYRAAFDLAVARGLYREAEPAARAYLSKEQGEPETHALAASVVLITRADRGEFEQSLADLKQFLARRAAAQVPDNRRLAGPLVCALGEAYLQRLIHGGRLDIARQVCHLGVGANHPDPLVPSYFAERLARLEMVGKPGPAIEGTDIDGKPVRLADLKGKVVLIDFWASWCPPCVASFPQIREMLLAHRDQGFAVFGVNLDALGQDPTGKRADSRTVLSTVRTFLLEHRASWPNLIGDSAEAVAKAYKVNEVPANFLVGRDGTIVQVELSGEALSRAVAQAVKGTAPAEPR